MKATVKAWIIEKARSEMRKYHLAPVFEYVYDEAQGGNYYKDTTNDTITVYTTDEIKETEKAIMVNLICETREGMNATDKTFKLWIPKSQLVELK